jgi:adenine-specific DNA-methyltransferase
MTEKSLTIPYANELPSSYADRLGILYSSQVSDPEKKDKGQFFTPPELAQFMVSFAGVSNSHVRILDPGCGIGILSATLIEKIVLNKSISSITLYLYETDLKLLDYTQILLSYLHKWLKTREVDFEWLLFPVDFIIYNLSLFSQSSDERYFDYIIANPPFFKLSKDDSRVIALSQLTSGISNIYAAFLALSAILLKPSGELIYIIPRSFASGLYFEDFRSFFFRNVRLEFIHLFKSRKDAFSRDKVLQETLILKGVKRSNPLEFGEVALSTSKSLKDIINRDVFTFREDYLIDFESRNRILHLPTNTAEINVLKIFKSWNGSLQKYGLQISTGPVISHKISEYICDSNNSGELIPLLWLHNVTKMKIEWPIHRDGKGQYVIPNTETNKWLIANKNYILLRRFSSKDDIDRLIAAPYFYALGSSDLIGIENKVNYIYRPNGHLHRSEVLGISALLNSEIFDTYFRSFNGNVNVSASELRAMPFPSLQMISDLGNRLIMANDFSMESVNKLINTYFKP